MWDKSYEQVPVHKSVSYEQLCTGCRKLCTISEIITEFCTGLGNSLGYLFKVMNRFWTGLCELWTGYEQILWRTEYFFHNTLGYWDISSHHLGYEGLNIPTKFGIYDYFSLHCALKCLGYPIIDVAESLINN